MKPYKSLLALVGAKAGLSGIVSLLLGLLPSPLQAAQGVTLAWNAVSGVAGYRLHYGTASRVYSQTTDVGNTTTAAVSHLTNGLTYYFVVTAYNATGLESLPSNQVSFTVTPHKSAISALQNTPNGSVQITVTDALGQTDSVYASSDLQTWTLLTSSVNSTNASGQRPGSRECRSAVLSGYE